MKFESIALAVMLSASALADFVLSSARADVLPATWYGGVWVGGTGNVAGYNGPGTFVASDPNGYAKLVNVGSGVPSISIDTYSIYDGVHAAAGRGYEVFTYFMKLDGPAVSSEPVKVNFLANARLSNTTDGAMGAVGTSNVELIIDGSHVHVDNYVRTDGEYSTPRPQGLGSLQISTLNPSRCLAPF